MISPIGSGWIDGAGNAKPKSRATPLFLAYWFAHIVILWSAVLVGVALFSQIGVPFYRAVRDIRRGEGIRT